MLPPPPLRAVLLGASNLHRGLRSLTGTLERAVGGPVEAWAAAGHGRSYGAPSRFAFVRSLPGILQSPLWTEIAQRPPLPTVAWVTDVGNDLLYGAPVASILGWVETALVRLETLKARTVLSLLPLARIERLSAAQFVFFRSLFFPGRRASWDGTLQRARALQKGLAELAVLKGALLLEPQLDWYRLDPIHVRRDRVSQVWAELLRRWGLPAAPGPPSRPRGLRLSHSSRLFGLRLAWPQPALRSPAGSTLHLH